MIATENVVVDPYADEDDEAEDDGLPVRSFFVITAHHADYA